MMKMAATIIYLLATGITYASEESSPGMLGNWEVERVLVDKNDQPHWLYKPADPRLLGRELRLEQQRASFNYGLPVCESAKWRSKVENFGKLLAGSYQRPDRKGKDKWPTNADFDLNAPAASANFPVFRLDCQVKQKKAEWDDIWLLQLDQNTLLMHLDSSVLLRLARHKPGVIKASFDCKKAGSKPEKTICSQPALAAWDRSVNLAWRRAQTKNNDENLKAAQIAWLKERDQCLDNAECLEDQMARRVEALMQE